MSGDEAIPTGQALVAEAAGLMRGLRVSTRSGATARGARTHIIISSVPGDETVACNLVLTCYAFGWQQVPWEGLPVIFRPEPGLASPTFVARLDRRGQAVVHNVPAGTYDLTVSERWYYSEEPVITSEFRQAVRHRGMPAGDTASEHGSGPVPLLMSEDALMRVKSLQPSPGRLALYFESIHEELVGMDIHFAIVNPSGLVAADGVVVLAGSDGETLWRAHWEGDFTESEQCHLMFEVIQAD